MNQEILEVKRDLIDDVIEYMKYGGAFGENDPEYDPEFDAGVESSADDITYKWREW